MTRSLRRSLSSIISGTARISTLFGQKAAVATLGSRSSAQLSSNMPTPIVSAVEAVEINGKKYRPIQEGLASILAPYRDPRPGQVHSATKKPMNNDEGDQAVFYNPIQQFNRDLSVLAILVYGEGAVIEKAERLKKRNEAAKRRRQNARKRMHEGEAGEDHTTPPPDQGVYKVLNGEPNLRKRKRGDAEDGEDQEQVSETTVKHRKTDFEEFDEELEVLELEGANITEEQTRPTAKDSESSAQTADPSHEPIGANTANESAQGSSADIDTTKPPVEESKRHGTPFTILDALSATGLRALRYAKEIPFATNIVANDLSSEAAKAINLNIDHNGVGKIVHSNVDDARAYMYSKVGNEQQPAGGKYIHRFDVIDLDPYGTAVPFFDASIQALQDGGLLCVTCTDAGVFASNGYPEKAYALYGGVPLKGAHSHEGGLRLILHAIATSAAKYGLAMEPLLSLSIDFYARIFVRVHRAQKEVKLLAGTTMIVYGCDYGCGAWNTQLIAHNHAKEDKKGEFYFKHGFAQAPLVSPNCEHCGAKTHLGGPMWAGPLHNPYFVQRILEKLPSLDKDIYATEARIEGMLTVALEEDLSFLSAGKAATQNNNNKTNPEVSQRTAIIPRLPSHLIDQTPFFFIPNYVSKVIHCQTPSEDQLRGAIRHLGYQVTRSHCKAGSFKTNAPWNAIWEIIREWARTKKPIKDDAVKPGTAGWAILANMRGSGRQVATEFKTDLAMKMKKAENLSDMKTILESAMYRLNQLDTPEGEAEQVPQKESDSVAAVNGSSTNPTPATSKLDIVFDEKLGRAKDRKGLVRYQVNPRANWGPMNRAGGQDSG